MFQKTIEIWRFSQETGNVIKETANPKIEVSVTANNRRVAKLSAEQKRLGVRAEEEETVRRVKEMNQRKIGVSSVSETASELHEKVPKVINNASRRVGSRREAASRNE